MCQKSVDCTGCGLPLDEMEKMNAGSPPMCGHCEESRCCWCGEFIYPVDMVQDGGGPCHKSCLKEMYLEDPGEVAEDDDFRTFNLENPDDGEYAGIPDYDEETPF